jgi:hypothetical protein
MLKYQLWMKILYYIGMLFIGSCAGFLTYSAISLFVEPDIGKVLIIAPLAAYMVYLTKVGSMLHQYISATVDYDNAGFNITNNECTKSYNWNEVTSIKDYPSVQILKVIGSESKPILIIDYMCFGYDEFRDALNVHNGI